jgi:hypothetical protein
MATTWPDSARRQARKQSPYSMPMLSSERVSATEPQETTDIPVSFHLVDVPGDGATRSPRPGPHLVIRCLNVCTKSRAREPSDLALQTAQQSQNASSSHCKPNYVTSIKDFVPLAEYMASAKLAVRRIRGSSRSVRASGFWQKTITGLVQRSQPRLRQGYDDKGSFARRLLRRLGDPPRIFPLSLSLFLYTSYTKSANPSAKREKDLYTRGQTGPLEKHEAVAEGE